MIKKQNLWFLTLFSLILVLGVYYVTIPNDYLAFGKVKTNTESNKKQLKVQIMHNNTKRTTPEFITQLQPNEIFVFGSNLKGMHGGGAAWIA